MSRRINQADNQVKFTNVAVVRLKRNGKRYEVCAYANKVADYRKGKETLDTTLQTTSIFENVNKATLYRKAQLMEAFDTSDEETICKIILEKGTAQSTEVEREHLLEKQFKKIATLVSEMCVNSQTMRPYPVSTIETALKETIHFSANSKTSAKRQAVEAIRKLEQHLPLKRAQMEIKITFANCNKDLVEKKLKQLQLNNKTKLENNKNTEEHNASNIIYKLFVDPGYYKKLTEWLASLDPPGIIEVLNFSVKKETEANVDSIALKKTLTTTKASEDLLEKKEALQGNGSKNGVPSKSKKKKQKK